MFVFEKKKSLSGNEGFFLFRERNATELMLWLIQETIAFGELTRLPKNLIKLSLLSSNTDESILHGEDSSVHSLPTW